MEGLTLSELAKSLGIPKKTVEMRLFRTGIKPIMRGAIYDKSTLEAIKKTPGRGRPKKQPEKKAQKPLDRAGF